MSAGQSAEYNSLSKFGSVAALIPCTSMPSQKVVSLAQSRVGERDGQELTVSKSPLQVGQAPDIKTFVLKHSRTSLPHHAFGVASMLVFIQPVIDAPR